MRTPLPTDIARTPQPPPHVGTIADQARLGHGITVNCLNRECLHRAALNLAKLPPELPIAKLVARAVCAEFGGRWPAISITVTIEGAPRATP